MFLRCVRVHAAYECVQVPDEFLQVISIHHIGRLNSCHLYLTFQHVCLIRVSNKNKSSSLTLFPASVFLLSFAFCVAVFPPLPSFFAFCGSSLSQMLPSSTSSTARPLRTSRSFVRLVLTPSLCPRMLAGPLLLRHPLLADPFLPYRRTRTLTPSPTLAPSPVSKACLCLSPPGGLGPRAYQSLSHSLPRCGGTCRGSGTVLSWRSSARISADCRR